MYLDIHFQNTPLFSGVKSVSNVSERLLIITQWPPRHLTTVKHTLSMQDAFIRNCLEDLEVFQVNLKYSSGFLMWVLYPVGQWLSSVRQIPVQDLSFPLPCASVSHSGSVSDAKLLPWHQQQIPHVTSP